MRSAQRPYGVILCGLCRNGGKAPLNDWLRRHAPRNEGRASRTFVVCQGDVVVGFYALAVASVESRDAPRTVRKNMPPQVPVLVLGRLAVDLGHHVAHQDWDSSGTPCGAP